MTKITLANGSETITNTSIEGIMAAIAAASPSPWIEVVDNTNVTHLLNSFVIGYMDTYE